MSISRYEARGLLFTDEVIGPAIGWRSTFTTLTPTAAIDLYKFTATYRGIAYLVNQGMIILPGADPNDRSRPPGLLTPASGSLANGGTPWSFSDSNVPYEFIRRGVTWDQLNAAFSRALEEVYFETTEPVSNVFPGGSFGELPYDSFAVDDPDLELTFSSDAAHNDTGFYSMLLNNTGGVDHYVDLAAPLHMRRGRKFWLGILFKILTPGLEAGSAIKFDVINDDTTASVDLTSLNYRSKGSYHLGKTITCPDDDVGLNLRITLPAGALVAIDAIANHYIDGLSWRGIPSWIDANWKLRRLEEYHYREGAIDSAGVTYASSRQYQSWLQRRDYTPEVLGEEVNPGGIQVLPPHKEMPACDLFYRGQRQVSDVYVEGEDNVVKARDRYVMAAYKVKVLSLLESAHPRGTDGVWLRNQRMQQRIVDEQRMVEETPAQAGTEPVHRRMAV